jgi:[CysO sulfur-carrier protein]-S-L-cysteine hydrolase
MIRIPKAVYDRMIGEAKRVYPEEACGFVVGKDGRVSDYIVIENMDHSTVSYAMDPKAQLRAFKRIQSEGLELLGIFHTHVASEASPSRVDREMAFYPEVSYLIASLKDMQNPELKSYKIAQDCVIQEEVAVE